MSSDNAAREAIENIISDGKREHRSMAEQIDLLTRKKRELEAKLLSLNETYQLLGGESLVDFGREETLLELSARLMASARKPLSADELVQRAAAEGRVIRKASLVTALIRSIEKGGPFRRAEGKNTFALREE